MEPCRLGRELNREGRGFNEAGRGTDLPAWLNVAAFLAGSALLLVLILVRTRGHFSYCLDDPYIHLALAERLRHGLYGLNAGEAASPSSSILWPLLFVPFAGTAWMPWLPLAVNVCCGAATAFMLGRLVAETFGSTGASGWRMPSLALLLLLALNLWGLAFTGLEHSLQVLLCVACALATVRVMRGGPVPGWGIAAAIMLPSVRYEGLLITLGFALVLAGARAWGKAFGVLAASVVVPAAFSVFLHRLGLPWFPLSVLVKSSYKFQDQSSLPVRIARLVFQTVKQSFFDMERLPQLVIVGLLVWLLWRSRQVRRVRFALAAAAMVGAVQVVLGPVGWFYRYEIYALAFTLPLLLAGYALNPVPVSHGYPEDPHQTVPSSQLPSGSVATTSQLLARVTPSLAVLLSVALIALVYVRPTIAVPRASLGIYEQQYQLGRLTRDFYHAPVAVNDLGWVAFGRTASQYTLDLYGLGSYEAFRTKEKDRTPAWLDAITREHGVGLVALYPEWFRQGVPSTWTPVAKLCATDVDTSLGPVSRRVMLYRTDAGEPAQIDAAIAQWRAELPSQVLLEISPVDAGETCR